MTQEEMKRRTREFAKRIIKFCRALPDTREGKLIGNQLFQAGTSVASNYRAGCRGRSTAEFVAKLGIVEEECDESLYWLELLRELQIFKPELLTELIQEGNEILSIIVSSIKTAKQKSDSKHQSTVIESINPQSAIQNPKSKKSEIRNPKSEIHRCNIFEFDGFKPVIHESAFIHPHAAVTGNVIIGRDVYVGPGAAIRGDWGEIIIEDGCNVQENCTIHMFPGVTVVLEESAHIGHGAIVHGGRIGRNSLVGMNAVVMDNVIVGEECIIGALCFVPEGMEIPRRKIVVGNPAKIVKDVSDEMIAWKTEGTRLYQSLPKQLYETLKPCEPLREVPEVRPEMLRILETWHQRNQK